MFLELHEVHIWQSDLILSREKEKQQALLLDAPELARANRFRAAQHRRRFIAARSMLRQVLSLYLHINPHAIDFCYTAHRKPYLAKNNLSLTFNVSHAADQAVIAVTRENAIGIDI